MDEMMQQFSKLRHDIASWQCAQTKIWFNAANLFCLGSLTPYADPLDKVLDSYLKVIESVGQELSQHSNLASSQVQDTMQNISDQQQEAAHKAIDRLTPDYSNLRARAAGDIPTRQSIMDDDSMWEGQPSSGKSSHRYDTQQRERVKET